MSERKLVRGWNCPAPGITIRLAGPDDLQAVADLVPTTGHALGPGVTDAIRCGVIGTAHRAGLAARGSAYGQPAFSRAIAQAAVEHGIEGAYAAAALALVAEHRDRGIVGTLVAFPPAHVSQQFVTRAEQAGASPRAASQLALAGAVALTKINALAVAESSRRSGVGAALLSRATKVYFANGYVYVYGQIAPDRAELITFYQRRGFEVRQPDEGLDLWVVFGLPGGIRPDQGERIFVRTNSSRA